MSGLLENVRRFIDSLGYESDVVHIVTFVNKTSLLKYQSFRLSSVQMGSGDLHLI